MIVAWFGPPRTRKQRHYPAVEILNLDPVRGHPMELENEKDISRLEEKLEELRIAFREGRPLIADRSFLVGWALTRAFHPLIQTPDLLRAGPAVVEKAMEEFHRLVISSVPPIFRPGAGIPPEKPCVLGALSRKKLDEAAAEQGWPPGFVEWLLKNEAFLLWFEVYFFVSAVKKWLGTPRLKPQTVEELLDPQKMFSILFSALKFFYEKRLQQTRIVPHLLPKGKHISLWYEVVSEGLLPLAWAELAMALQWKIPATFCPECGGLMRRGREKTCGDADCLRRHREKRLATLENDYRKRTGLPLIEDVAEAARAYNRRKQRDLRGR